MGPFSIVNRNSGLAFAVDDSTCANGMSLSLADDDHTSLTQQFYLGQHGSIFSAKCQGLVIEAIDMDSVQLQIFRVDDKTQKWKFTDGMIESAMHPGMVLARNDQDAFILKSNSESADQSLNWIRVNTRLLDSNSVTSGWKQQWKASFIDSGYKSPLLGGFIHNNNALAKHCYAMNSAFSASFDNFAQELVVNDPGDEDQCRKVREALGFDKDYPFDVDVSENFHKHQCDPFFSGVDHVSGDDMEALTVSVSCSLVQMTCNSK